jgi:hypothetical protein
MIIRHVDWCLYSEQTAAVRNSLSLSLTVSLSVSLSLYGLPATNDFAAGPMT